MGQIISKKTQGRKGGEKVNKFGKKKVFKKKPLKKLL